MINWRQRKIEYKKDLKRIMCFPPKLSIFKKKMLNINRQLTQSLRTINIILFVRLKKRDGMAWISIFKPAPPVCVTKRFDPLLKWKLPLRSARLAASGGNKITAKPDRNQRRLEAFVYSGGDDQVQERCKCPDGVRVPRVRAAALSVIFSVSCVSSETKRSPASRRAAGPRRPRPAWPGSGTCWSGTPSPAQSAPWCRSQSSGARWPCDRPCTRCYWVHRLGAPWLETGHQKIRSMGWPRKDAQEPSE